MSTSKTKNIILNRRGFSSNDKPKDEFKLDRHQIEIEIAENLAELKKVDKKLYDMMMVKEEKRRARLKGLEELKAFVIANKHKITEEELEIMIKETLEGNGFKGLPTRPKKDS